MRPGGNLSASTSSATLERDLIDRCCFRTQVEVRHAVFDSTHAERSFYRRMKHS